MYVLFDYSFFNTDRSSSKLRMISGSFILNLPGAKVMPSDPLQVGPHTPVRKLGAILVINFVAIIIYILDILINTLLITIDEY